MHNSVTEVRLGDRKLGTSYMAYMAQFFAVADVKAVTTLNYGVINRCRKIIGTTFVEQNPQTSLSKIHEIQASMMYYHVPKAHVSTYSFTLSKRLIKYKTHYLIGMNFL